MSPIDWTWSPYKNPLGGDTPVSALLRKWRVRILFDYGWGKVYLVTLICGLYLLGIIIWWELQHSPVGWAGHGILQQMAVMLVPPMFFVVRIHIASVPALVIMADTKKSLWDHFRMTTVTGDDVSKAMLMHSLNYGVLPLAIVSLVETLFYLHAIGTDIGTAAIFLQAPLIFFLYLFYGLFLCGLGITGVLIWRNLYGVLIGVIAPILISAIFAGPFYIIDMLKSFGSRYPIAPSQNFATLIIAPENRIAFSETVIVRQGFTSISSTDPAAMLGMIVALAIFSALVWVGLWLVLRRRLDYG